MHQLTQRLCSDRCQKRAIWYHARTRLIGTGIAKCGNGEIVGVPLAPSRAVNLHPEPDKAREFITPGSQVTSHEWQLFLGQHNLEARMSRRGNCHDRAMGAIGSSPMARAVAESFFQLLKRERIRRSTYLTREAARQDVFDYIEMPYNPKRKHTNNGMLRLVDFEARQQKLNEAGAQETRGTSGSDP
jgi:transposase InsO family protein